MKAHASSLEPSLRAQGADDVDPFADAADAADGGDGGVEQASDDEWAILVRPRHSRREYVRQIAIDAAVVLIALVVIALLS